MTSFQLREITWQVSSEETAAPPLLSSPLLPSALLWSCPLLSHREVMTTHYVGRCGSETHSNVVDGTRQNLPSWGHSCSHKSVFVGHMVDFSKWTGWSWFIVIIRVVQYCKLQLILAVDICLLFFNVNYITCFYFIPHNEIKRVDCVCSVCFHWYHQQTPLPYTTTLNCISISLI